MRTCTAPPPPNGKEVFALRRTRLASPQWKSDGPWGRRRHSSPHPPSPQRRRKETRAVHLLREGGIHAEVLGVWPTEQEHHRR